MLTYKDLYTLFIKELEKRGAYPSIDSWKDQLARSQLQEPVSFSAGSVAVVEMSDLMNSIVALLSELIPPRIKTGLTVTETDPISKEIKVVAGEGVVGGKIYRLNKEVEIEIPFDSTTTIFYVVLYINGVKVERIFNPNQLTLAKIIVPYEGLGVTDRVKNKRNDDYEWDAYIVNFKEFPLYGDGFDNLEEDSIDMLRDNIGDILADNIIGNIRLNEDLKIINTAGTLELNSDSLKLYDLSSNLMAEFNKEGTFFYDTSGREMAKFSVDEARVGNIKITQNAIESANYFSEVDGFRIRDDGYAEFDDVRVRGRLSSSVFEYDKISAVGGKLYVGNATVLTEDVSTTTTEITVEDSVFQVDEIILFKDGTNQEYMQVTDISSAPTYIVSRNLSEAGESGATFYNWYKGQAVVSTGNINQANRGFMSLDTVSEYSPFMDILYRNSSAYDDYTTKVRLGKLDGIPGCSGFGIWGGDGYLGALEVINVISISSQGAIRSNLSGTYPYLQFSQDGLQLKDSDAGGTYGTAVYGTDKYGYGALGWIMNAALKIPFAVLKEPNAGASDVADLRLYSRSDDPGGVAEIGDICVVSGKLKICTSAGTPGTWTVVGAQTA